MTTPNETYLKKLFKVFIPKSLLVIQMLLSTGKKKRQNDHRRPAFKANALGGRMGSIACKKFAICVKNRNVWLTEGANTALIAVGHKILCASYFIKKKGTEQRTWILHSGWQ
jgi:hypothetical protein